MRILSKESFSVVQQQMPDNYANLYSRISLQLPPDIAACFAKYTKLTAHNSGQWSIDCEGEEDFKPITQAAPHQRMAASDTLRRISEAISRAGIVSDPEKLLTVPDESCIYFRQLPSGEVDIVIAQWGHRKIGSAASINNISLILNGDDNGQDRTDVNIRLQWSDEMPLAQTPVQIGIYGSSFEKKSDDNGVVRLGTVATGERFTIDVEGQKTVVMHTDDSPHEYLAIFPWYVDAKVTVVNPANEPVKTTVNANGQAAASDDNGVVEITHLLMEKEATLSIDYEGRGMQKFPLHHDSALNDFKYVVTSLPPQLKEDSNDVVPPMPPAMPEETPLETGNNLKVTIRLVDKKRRPLAYTRVRVNLQKGYEVTSTDADGFIYIERQAFTQGEKVKITVLPNTQDKTRAPKNHPTPPVSPTPPTTPATPATPPSTPPAPATPATKTPPPAKGK